MKSSKHLLHSVVAVLFLAACTDSSIKSPGESGQVDDGGSAGGGGSSANYVDMVANDDCPTGSSIDEITNGSVTVRACKLTGSIQSDMTLTAEDGFILQGPVFVGEDDGPSTSSNAGNPVTLTIEAGTTIFGASGEDYLVVSRGSDIVADGTSVAPIIFTSFEDAVTDTASEGDRGKWGGLVINGRAPINHCTVDPLAVGGTADCEKTGEGSSGTFGGDDPTDSSGILRYVQIKYAGFKLSNDDELNGIGFQGVGNGTVVDYIQVHNNADDGIEFFGGTVNAKHIVLTGNADDSMDWTDGWTGQAQFVLVMQASDASDNGMEMDNRDVTFTNLPRSNPTVANFTLIGQAASTKSDYGMLLRHGTAGQFLNGIIVDFNDACIDIDTTETFDRIGATGAAGDETLTMVSTFVDCATDFEDEGGDPAGKEPSAFFAAGANNTAGISTMSGVFPGINEQAVTEADPTAIDAVFFDAVDYIGAFDPATDETTSWASGWTYGVFPDVACPTGTVENTSSSVSGTVCTVTGPLVSDLRLVRGPSYELNGPVFVGIDSGPDSSAPLAAGVPVTLSIDAGVTIFGASGADYLVITRGSKIESNGTAVAPVTMTSKQDVEGTVGVSDRGQWGGLVINGRAPINHCTVDPLAVGGTADCEKSGEGSSGLFGGAEADDDSGHIYYTVVKYAGFKLSNDDELNGIGFQGVGNNTEVDYVQVHNNADDGVEFFGGTVEAKHIILTGNADDSMDWTDGWTGKAQYVIVQQAADSSDNGMEMDNRDVTFTNLPRSNPTVSNFTLVGQSASSASDYGMLLRHGTAGHFVNGIIIDFNDACIDIDTTETFDRIGATGAAGDEQLIMTNTFVDCATDFEDEAGDPAGKEPSAFFAGGAGNDSATSNGMSGHTFVTGATGVVPDALVEGAMSAADPSSIDGFFDAATYLGAVENGSDDWWTGWSYSE